MIEVARDGREEANQREAAATRANGLAPFFERQRRRAERHVALPVALLSARPLRYLARRAVPLLARLPVRTALHIAELIVFWDFIELGYFGKLLMLRSAAAAFGAFHWGTLEPLRERVRALVRQGDVRGAELTTARFLRIAIDLCIVALGLLLLWLELGPRPFRSFSIFDAYGIGCGVRLCAETLARTYHAGAYALRRVPRPLAAFLAVDIVEAGTALALWPYLGPWGFALSQLVGGAVDATLTYRYARLTYNRLPVTPPTLSRVLSGEAHAPWSLWREVFAPGIGNFVTQVDALLVAALASSASRADLTLGAALHALRPVLSLGTGWTRTFYFDLSTLAGTVRGLFRPRLERVLLRAAPWFALTSLAVAALLAALFAPQTPWSALLGFTPFLVARALFAVTQIQAFARGAYAALAVGSVPVIALVFGLPHAELTAPVLLAAASAALVVAAVVFARAQGRQREPGEGDVALAPLVFLGWLAQVPGRVDVLVLTLADGAGARAARVVRSLGELPGVVKLARFGSRTLVVAADDARSLVPALVTASSGCLGRLEVLPPEPNGRGTLRALVQGGHAGLSLDPDDAPNPDELRRHFEREVGGYVLDATSRGVPHGAATARILGYTLGEVSASAGGVRLARRRGLKSAVYAPGGAAELVFIAGPGADAERMATFAEAARRASLAATLRQ